MNKVVGTSLNYWLCFNYNSQFIIFLLLVQTAISEKNDLGTSSASMFSHYTAIKLSINVINFFFHANAACVFLLNSILISQKQCTGFFFHSSSVLNTKDLIILTFITITEYWPLSTCG